MAAPNIVQVTSIIGKSLATALTDTSATVVLNNPASSNKLLRVNSVRATNIDGTNPCDITLSYATEDDGGGTLHRLASTISVPADAVLILLDKSDALNLEEDRSLVAVAGAGNDIAIVVSYDEIDDA